MQQIYYNGQVFTGELPLCQAFAVKDGLFTAVGSNEDVIALKTEGDTLIDLQGQFVCAGFNDSHMHLVNFGSAMENCELSSHTSSLEDVQGALRAFIAQRKPAPGTWVRGRGWNHDYFAGATGIPTRWDLDKVSTEHPICITRCCGHCLVVNSKALDMLGIDGSAPQVDGGHYDLDENGVPTGVFRDAAMSMIYTQLPIPSKDDVKRMILCGSKALNRVGVTSCQTDDLCAFEGLHWQDVIDAYRELEAEGLMTVRVYEQSQLTTLPDLQDFINRGYCTGVGSDFFRIGPLKILGDGSLGARTAFLSGEYADAPGERGLAIFTQEQFDELIGYAHCSGMQVAVHAIGDGILDRILLAYEKAFASCPARDHRSGIVHVQLTRPDQLRKMQELNLHAYVQTIFLDYDTRIVQARAGQQLAGSSYAFHTLKEMGLHVSNGTDCPVEAPLPLRGLQCAVTRCTLDGYGPYRPEEAMTVEEALRSYTAEGAYSSFAEHVKGRITSGMLADFTVLNGNPFDIPASKISSLSVTLCAVGGDVVYQA